MDQTICVACTAEGGMASDRCERCQNHSAFETPTGLSMASVRGEAPAATLAALLIVIDALTKRVADLEDTPQLRRGLSQVLKCGEDELFAGEGEGDEN